MFKYLTKNVIAMVNDPHVNLACVDAAAKYYFTTMVRAIHDGEDFGLLPHEIMFFLIDVMSCCEPIVAASVLQRCRLYCSGAVQSTIVKYFDERRDELSAALAGVPNEQARDDVTGEVADSLVGINLDSIFEGVEDVPPTVPSTPLTEPLPSTPPLS